ncbi:MAG: prepilin-type N-terminal cleavage/methylation domain-containing protein [Thermodesulfobacteria bacterium]|nr:prepilin-type N-terminal cleavage/methylation domain-containing protein [Thermodesulfobacteriota bacterium]
MKKRAFTLIELAIVLAIIGILLGIGIKVLNILTKRVKYNQAKDVLSGAVESITNFAAFNNRLPTPSEFPTVVRVPRDPWNKDLIYIPASGIDNTTNICGIKNTNLTVKYCKDPDCKNYDLINNVAFVVLSGGANYNVQTSNSSPITVYPYGTPDVDDYPYDFDRKEPYDDIVKWVTLYELQAKLQCQTGTKGRLTIITPTLPYGFVDSNYRAEVYAEGGIPFSDGSYKWCVEGSLPAGISVSPNSTSSNCSDLDESLWGEAKSLTFNGTPKDYGTYDVKVFVRDNADPNGSNDNIAEKSFVIVINPKQSSSSSSAPEGAQVSFANDINDFVQTTTNGINVDSNTGTLFLGTNEGNTNACFWYPSVYSFSNGTLRAYFEFKTLYVDTSSNSTAYADGFTFALIGKSIGTSACGGAGGGLGFSGIGSPSAAVEFDYYPNSSLHDPERDHMDIDADGSVTHSVPFSGYYDSSSVNWMENGQWHPVRIEAYQNGTKTCFKVWMDCTATACKDLNNLYTATPTLQKCVDVTFPNGFYVGFTEGTGGANSNTEIANFGLAVK